MWDRLSNIKVPTLVIGGIYDEMNPEDIRKEGELIPNSRTYLCPNGSHISMYDDQQNYFNSLIGFLKDVETTETMLNFRQNDCLTSNERAKGAVIVDQNRFINICWYDSV